MNGLDDNTIKKIIFSALIGALIGSLGTFAISYHMWSVQDRYEKYQIANGFLTEIIGHEGPLMEAHNDTLIDESYTSIEKRTPYAPDLITNYQYKYIYKVIQSPIPKSTMYNTFMRDSFGFYGDLPYDLYVFYTNLQTAEEARQRILDLDEREESGERISHKNETQVFLSNQYRSSLNVSVSILPKLKKELYEEVARNKYNILP